MEIEITQAKSKAQAAKHDKERQVDVRSVKARQGAQYSGSHQDSGEIISPFCVFNHLGYNGRCC